MVGYQPFNPFETFEFFCSCIRGSASAEAVSARPSGDPVRWLVTARSTRPTASHGQHRPACTTDTSPPPPPLLGAPVARARIHRTPERLVAGHRTHIEFRRSELSNISAHVSGVTGHWTERGTRDFRTRSRARRVEPLRVEPPRQRRSLRGVFTVHCSEDADHRV